MLYGPCPCCGNVSVEFLITHDHWSSREHWFQCRECGAMMHHSEDTDGEYGFVIVTFNPNEL